MDKTYSFIIPHHNTPELLKRLVDSIPRRDDVEIIVVDDNSVEEKRANVVRNDVQTFYIDKEHTKGAGRARNVGLENAKGKWLIFADSDDFFSEAISDLLDKYKDSESDIIYFKVMGRDSDTLKTVSRGMNYNNYLDKFKSKQNEISEDMLKYFHVVPWCKIIRRSLVADNNIKYEEVRYSNDVMFVTRTAHCANKIEVADVVAYNVTIRSGSLITQKNPESRKCRFDVSMRRLRFLWDNHKWHVMPPMCRTLISRLIRYGLGDIKMCREVMNGNGIGWYKVIMSEIIADYNGIIRKFS